MGEHAKQAILVKEPPNYLIVANWVVQYVPKAIFQAEQCLFKVARHFAIDDGLRRQIGVPACIIARAVVWLALEPVHDVVNTGKAAAGLALVLELEVVLDHEV